MTELTDAQCAVLAPALTRSNRCIYPITAALKGGAVGNIAKSLLKRRLLEEAPADDCGTVWRCDDEGQSLTLRITDAGVRALSGEVVHASERPESHIEPPIEIARSRIISGTRDVLVTLLTRAEGATIADMTHATGWLPHSVRGALSGVIAKKLGHTVTSVKDDARGRVYRIMS